MDFFCDFLSFVEFSYYFVFAGEDFPEGFALVPGVDSAVFVFLFILCSFLKKVGVVFV